MSEAPVVIKGVLGQDIIVQDPLVEEAWGRVARIREAAKLKRRAQAQKNFANNPAMHRPPTAKGRRKEKLSIANGREAVARFVELNVTRMQAWLDEIAATEGPLVAFKCVTDVIEYHIPKLARTEHTGAEEGPVEILFSWKPPAN
jgi:hypothetical protein